MRYKIGEFVVIVSTPSTSCLNSSMNKWCGQKMKISDIFKSDYVMEEDTKWLWEERMIDHEATAKLNTLPQPHKSMLRSGMKVVHRDARVRYILVETNTFHNKDGEVATMFDSFDDKLIARIKTYDIMQIWDGNNIIAQRTEKSEADLKKESILAKIAELQSEVDKL